MRLIRYKKIKKILESDPVRIVTYQHMDVLKNLEKNGHIAGCNKHAPLNEPTWESLRQKYIWMQNQMKQRLPDYSGDLPIWAWLENSSNISVKKRFGEKQVRIIADVPKNRCLISDFDSWEGVMNGMWFTIDEKKFDEWIDNRHIVSKEDLEKTWEVCFDLKPVRSKQLRELMYPSEAWKGRYLQACVDRIYQNEIKSIKIYD